MQTTDNTLTGLIFNIQKFSINDGIKLNRELYGQAIISRQGGTAWEFI